MYPKEQNICELPLPVFLNKSPEAFNMQETLYIFPSFLNITV